MKGWFLAFLAILPGASLIPFGVKQIFTRLDYTVQEETRWSLVPIMLAPSLVMFGLLFGTKMWKFDIAPDRLPMLGSWPVFLGTTLALNVLATVLFVLQTSVWWEEKSGSKLTEMGPKIFWLVTLFVGVVVNFLMWQ